MFHRKALPARFPTPNVSTHTRGALVAAALIAASSPAASAQELAITQTQGRHATAAVPDELGIARAAGAIDIDGRVDEAAWRNARRVTDFREFQPGHMTEPAVRTEAFVTYDDENLYIAIIAHDEPGQVRASLTERDDMFADDWAGVILDTWGDASWGYLIIANAYGVQGDTRITANGDDEMFDVIFDSDGAITERGFEVELAIPFSSLRFRGDTENWRIGFLRNHPRDARRMYSWPALDSNNPCVLCQFGEMVTLAGVRPGETFSYVSLAGAIGGSPSSKRLPSQVQCPVSAASSPNCTAAPCGRCWASIWAAPGSRFRWSIP